MTGTGGNIGMTAVACTPNVRVMNAGAAWRLKIASAAGLIAHARANPEQLARGLQHWQPDPRSSALPPFATPFGRGSSRAGYGQSAQSNCKVRTPCCVASRQQLAFWRANTPTVTTPGHWLVSFSKASGSVMRRPRTSRMCRPLSVT